MSLYANHIRGDIEKSLGKQAEETGKFKYIDAVMVYGSTRQEEAGRRTLYASSIHCVPEPITFRYSGK